MTSNSRWFRVAWLATAMVASVALADPTASGAAGSSSAEIAPAAVDTGPPVNAVWVEHDLHFTYAGYSTYYSCYGLQNKVEHVLEQVGARKEDLKVNVLCMNSSGAEYMPSVRIHVAMPAEATPELLARLAQDAPRRELVARVRGDGAAADIATAQFPAVWRTVVLEGRRLAPIDSGDCELLEQMVEAVFKPIGARVADGSTFTCTPRQARFGSVLLKLQLLQKQPGPDESKTPGPAEE